VKPQSRRLSQKLLKRRQRKGQALAEVGMAPAAPAAPVPVPPPAAMPKRREHGEMQPVPLRFRPEHHGMLAGLGNEPDVFRLEDVVPLSQT